MKNNSFKAPQRALGSNWPTNFTKSSKSTTIIKRSLANNKGIVIKEKGEVFGITSNRYEY